MSVANETPSPLDRGERAGVRGQAASDASPPPPWHWPLTRALPIALLSVTLVTLGSLLFHPTNYLPADVPDVAFIEALVRWDAGWYGEIANNGYWLKPGEQSPVAFFPLYPLLIRGVAAIGLNRWLAGILVSFFCALGGLLVFFRWARLVAPTHALTAFWLLAVYPFAEYLYGVVYSDALFLLLAVGAFASLERGRHLQAALLGALSTACRPVAPAIVIGLLVRSVELRRTRHLPIRFIDLVPALSGLGLACFMGYLQYRFGDALAFAHVQGAPGWDQEPGWRSWLKLYWFHTMFPKVDPLVGIRLGGHALFTVLGLVLVVPTIKRLGWGYGVYTLLVIGIPAVSSKDFQGLGRYLIAAFPLFLTVAHLVDPRPRLRLLLLVVFGLLLGALAMALGAGGYVS